MQESPIALNGPSDLSLQRIVLLIISTTSRRACKVNNQPDPKPLAFKDSIPQSSFSWTVTRRYRNRHGNVSLCRPLKTFFFLSPSL